MSESRTSVDQFMDSVRRSGLVSEPQLATLSQKLLSTGTATAHEIAAKLVERQTLTQYQVEQLLAGRGEECVLAGRYQLLEQLGAGAMGMVFRARDTKLDRLVALKVLPGHSLNDPDAVARFQREAKALAKLSHTNIAQAHDSGEDRGRHFLVMEYVEGSNLAQVLRTKGRIAPTLAADYVYQAARGLEHAHQKGLVHRDLKPGNLLLGPDGEVKILDLGLARFLQDQIGEPGLTREGVGMGTPDYMAPEQFRDARTVDHRADIYSLGCTLYHLLSGQVPFPGSSLTEKAIAHEQNEPVPIEERCPEVPAGLALVVRRMMGKHPADRFQTAADAAAALAPYVAGSSHALPRILATASWHGSQLSITVPPARGRVRRWGIAIATVAALLVLAMMPWSRLFRSSGSSNVPNLPETPPVSGEVTPREPDDSNVLTVAQDGSGQFRTIGDALKAAKRRNIIRVLDDAAYSESLVIEDPIQHEGILLEAPKRATITLPENAASCVSVHDVPHVRLRGFRFQGSRPMGIGSAAAFITVSGNATGGRIEEIALESSGAVYGIVLKNVTIPAGELPLVVERCSIQTQADGITIRGPSPLDAESEPSGGLVIRENRVAKAMRGIFLQGSLARIQVVGNLVWNCSQAGLQLSDQSEKSDGILVANNTCFGSASAFRVWNDFVTPERPVLGKVEVRRNVLFDGSTADMAFTTPTRDEKIPVRGDPEYLFKTWRFEGNWRDVGGTGGHLLPLAEQDKKIAKTVFVSRDSSNPAFMRPSAGSSLNNGGAGGDLPQYAGALPPEGVESWDWRKTWDARHPKMLLTVSKDPKDGGEFRSINEALAKVDRPGMTVRVLDDGLYSEPISMTKENVHQGLTLEAPKHATLIPPSSERFGILIQNVSRVTVRGFRLRADHEPLFLVEVAGRSQGIVLEDLDCRSRPGRAITIGVQIENLGLVSDETPIAIRKCTFAQLGAGVRIIGMTFNPRNPILVGGVVVQENTMSDCFEYGIELNGLLKRVAVVGNRIWGGGKCGMMIKDMLEDSGAILISNNTFKDPQSCLLVQEPIASRLEVEIKNNLFLANQGPDMELAGVDPKTIETWRIEQNWRQVQGSFDRTKWIEPSKDKVQGQIDLEPLEPTNSNYLRPPKGSPLGSEGIGGDLPEYVGAIPPDGVEPWDWHKTWQARRAVGGGAPKQEQ